MKRLEDTLPSTEEIKSSTVFSASFAGKLTDTIFTDTRSDVDLADSASVENMQVSGAILQFQNLTKPAVYSLAVDKSEEGESLKIVCNTHAYCDVELHE